MERSARESELNLLKRCKSKSSRSARGHAWANKSELCEPSHLKGSPHIATIARDDHRHAPVREPAPSYDVKNCKLSRLPACYQHQAAARRGAYACIPYRRPPWSQAKLSLSRSSFGREKLFSTGSKPLFIGAQAALERLLNVGEVEFGRGNAGPRLSRLLRRMIDWTSSSRSRLNVRDSPPV